MSGKDAAKSEVLHAPGRAGSFTLGRVALLSSPRAGSTWLTHLLTALYGVPSRAVHYPTEVHWETLPDEYVLKLHWHRSPTFVEQLHRHRFQIVVLARHPLDVLISILHFSLRSPTAPWLEGEAGGEASIRGAMPRSTPFLEYATGPRAAALLSVTREWWHDPTCFQLRYEDLVERPEDEVQRLVDALGGKPHNPIGEALEATTLANLRTVTQCKHHFWQGRPGLWKDLLPAGEARRIAAAHPAVFAELGYAWDADPELTAEQADANWVHLAGTWLADELRELQATQRELRTIRDALAMKERELELTQRALAAAHRGIDDLRQELREERARRIALEQLGPIALAAARRLHGLAMRWPRLTALGNRLLRRKKVAEC